MSGRHARRQDGPDAEGGFTLLEVLVALTILALSVAVLFGIFADTLARTRADNRAMQARALAQALLAEAETYPPLADRVGTERSGLMWRLHIVRPQAENDGPLVGLRSETVSASVRWADDGTVKSLTLTTLVIARKERAS